jgi:DNA-binding response OmpR family regulator
VIFYSALPVELLQREALGLDSGAYYYLSKTGSVSDLVGTIKALCEY